MKHSEEWIAIKLWVNVNKTFKHIRVHKHTCTRNIIVCVCMFAVWVCVSRLNVMWGGVNVLARMSGTDSVLAPHKYVIMCIPCIVACCLNCLYVVELNRLNNARMSDVACIVPSHSFSPLNCFTCCQSSSLFTGILSVLIRFILVGIL